MKTNELIAILVDETGDPKACYYDGHDDGIIVITNDYTIWDRISKDNPNNN